MHTTEIEIPIRPLSEIFPHLEFYRNRATSDIIAVTRYRHPKTLNLLTLGLYAEGIPDMIWESLNTLESHFEICENPCDYRSGAALVQSLHNRDTWDCFMRMTPIPDQYTGKLEFWLEYSPEKAPYKEAAYPNSSTGNVTAIIPDTKAGIWHNTYECFTAGHGVEPNAEQIHSIRIGHDMLHNRCVQITEKEARIIHPNLFEYLKENFKK
jgi:hypothetical protein